MSDVVASLRSMYNRLPEVQIAAFMLIWFIVGYVVAYLNYYVLGYSDSAIEATGTLVLVIGVGVILLNNWVNGPPQVDVEELRDSSGELEQLKNRYVEGEYEEEEFEKRIESRLKEE